MGIYMAPKKNQGRNRKAKKALSKNVKKVVTKMQEVNSLSNTNVDETSVEQNTTPVVQNVEEQSGGSSVDSSVENTASVLTAPSASKSKKSKAKPKKLVKPKSSQSVSEPVNESEVQTELATMTETTTVSQVGSGKQVRSFKVRLPGNDSFEGRFTGLTPYQAANKALSKYYRETDKPKKQIQFTIRESTRGSKRSLYTYNG